MLPSTHPTSGTAIRKYIPFTVPFSNDSNARLTARAEASIAADGSRPAKNWASGPSVFELPHWAILGNMPKDRRPQISDSLLVRDGQRKLAFPCGGGPRKQIIEITLPDILKITSLPKGVSVTSKVGSYPAMCQQTGNVETINRKLDLKYALVVCSIGDHPEVQRLERSRLHADQAQHSIYKKYRVRAISLLKTLKYCPSGLIMKVSIRQSYRRLPAYIRVANRSSAMQ